MKHVIKAINDTGSPVFYSRWNPEPGGGVSWTHQFMFAQRFEDKASADAVVKTLPKGYPFKAPAAVTEASQHRRERRWAEGIRRMHGETLRGPV